MNTWSRKLTKLQALAILLITIILSFIILHFIDKYALPILVRDRWHSLDPLFYKYNIWDGFTFQHGPHRMGLAFILFKVNAWLSGWNSRWDMFTQGVIYILCAIMALRLKFLIFKRIHWTDIVIPMIFITLHTRLTIIVNPYVHGLVPFFALAAGLSYFIRNQTLRILMLILVGFCGVFTGFALVVSFGIILVEAIRIFPNAKETRTPRWGSLFIITLLGSTFFYFALTNKPIPSETTDWIFSKMVRYSVLLFNNYFIFNPRDKFVKIGLIIIIVTLPLLYFFFRDIRKNGFSRTHQVILLLFSSTVVFNLLNIYGRSQLGLGNAITSRYIPGAMPMILGLYFIILRLPTSLIKLFYSGVFIVGLLNFQLKSHIYNDFIKMEHNYFLSWQECLRQQDEVNYQKCLNIIGYPLTPYHERVHLEEKLRYLKRNKLNIYLDK